MAETCVYTKVSKDQNLIKGRMKNICNRSIAFIGVLTVWQIMSLYYHNELLLPSPVITIKEFFKCIVDLEVLENMGITMGRVLKGFLLSLLFGLPLGFLMGYFRAVERAMGGIIDAVRQIPVMAWVPLTIVWFGIGDGPTLFLIAFSGVFPIILNTLEGVKGISSDYYNAARSMGASRFSLFKDVTLPAVVPDILTGARISISTGWMSVIWAEFIATSAGFGHSMVEAQAYMQTERLIALMMLAAVVGYTIDRGLLQINKHLTSWREI